MNSDNKPPRGRKPGANSRSGARSGKPGFGKGLAKSGFGKAARKGGKPFAKAGMSRDGAQKPSAKRAYGEGPPREAAAGAEPKPFAKREYGDRPLRRDGEQKPFLKRAYGERPPREAAAGAKPKPFAKRQFDDRPPRRAGDRKDTPAGAEAASRPHYWGKRPGKEERATVARGDNGKAGAATGHDGKPRRSTSQHDAPKRFEGGGDRPKRFSHANERRDRDGSSRAAAGPARDRKPFVPRDEAAPPESGERIAKRLARAGISSRRDAEALIAAGRVKVNGTVLSSPAFNVTIDDRIEVDGAEIPPIERTRLFLFHKPAGVVTTNRDPEGRRTVFDALPEGLPRLMTVGRLDINTEGLLLLTNDGGLSRVLELPATGWLRRYRVRVHGKVDEEALAGLRQGIAVGGVFYGAIEASLDKAQGSNAWLTIGLREGKNREVKNVLGSLGLDVARLIRISYGPFQLGELGEGEVLEIKGRTLRDQLGETLIEESGANFDAEIANPFSNRPVSRRDARPDHADDRPTRQPRQIGVEHAGGLIKNFRRDRDDRRDNALGRLSTTRPERPGYGGPDGFKRGDGEGRGGRFARPPKAADRGKPSFAKKPSGKREREERPVVEPGVRKANVWMAPGARPQAKKPSERAAHKRLAADSRPRGERPPQKPTGQFRGQSGDRPRGERPQRSRPRGPRPGGSKR